MTIISEQELQNWLIAHPQWVQDGDEIRCHLTFKNFIEAFGFLAQVAILAEKQDHHPAIHNVYNRVTLSLSTHDAGNKITDRDLKLAQAIDDLRQVG